MTARILVCDDISPEGLRPLLGAGFDLVSRPGIERSELIDRIVDFDALLVRSRTRVDKTVLHAAKRLQLVARAGIGLAKVDVAEATRRGVSVMRTLEGPEVTAAEYTIGLLFALARHIPQAHQSMKAGRWDKRRFRGVELFGKTLGVVGMGRVGKQVVLRARALGMRVIVHDPGLPPAEIESVGATLVSWDGLLAEADFITVHVPSGPVTRGLLDTAAFERMREGVRIVHCARGDAVDEDALARAVRSGKVAGAAVDVFDAEAAQSSPLVGLPQVIATPHLVASTFEAQIKVAERLAHQVSGFFTDGSRVGVVNPDATQVAASG